MRITIDIPDSLMDRVKEFEGNRTFASFVITSLETAIESEPRPFTLRDASVGSRGSRTVSSEIDEQIDALRDPTFDQ